MVSQIERGLVMPSVSTLWSIASELNMTLEGLFSEPERAAPPAPDTPPPGAVRDGGPIQRLADRKSIRLAGGVVWGQLATGPGDEPVGRGRRAGGGHMGRHQPHQRRADAKLPTLLIPARFAVSTLHGRALRWCRLPCRAKI